MSVVLATAALVAAMMATPLPRRAVGVIRRARIARRQSRARVAFPALIDALAAALRSGLSLPQAFVEIAPSAPPGLAAASRFAAAGLFLGDTVEDACSCYRAVIPAQDVGPLTVVLVAFVRAGGRVGGSLDRLSALLRGRLALENERAALTAQSRASAVVLISLAPIGAVFFSLAMPDYGPTLLGDGIALAALAIGFELVGAFWLWWLVRANDPRVDLAMLLDALVVGIDAGLTFERALASVVERSDDIARASDVRRLLADLRLGIPLRDALARFARNDDESQVASLISTSSRFGAPLVHLLVTQAETLRATERHRAEATARRLPVTMLFPLALCILPALLIVFLGPPVITLLR